jgi:hypothetical protein
MYHFSNIYAFHPTHSCHEPLHTKQYILNQIVPFGIPSVSVFTFDTLPNVITSLEGALFQSPQMIPLSSLLVVSVMLMMGTILYLELTVATTGVCDC